MPVLEIPIGRREAKAKSPFVSSQSAINCFAERDPEPGIPDSIYGGPGLTEFADCGAMPIRGAYTFGDSVLAVSGDTLYTIDENGDETARGAITGYDPVIISDNGTHAAIVADAITYLWDGTTLSAITDPDFRVASSVDFLDQYLAFSERDASRYFLSDLASASSYDALQVATAEYKPDRLLRVFADGGELLLFGTKTVEGRYNAGSSPFPLQKTQTRLDYGLAGRDAVARIDNTVAWLAPDGTLRTLRSDSPIAVADPSITTAIQGWTNPGSARAFSFSIRGHEWLALRHAQGCYLWDATTGLWSRRQSHNSDTWRVACGTRAFGHELFGDAESGKIWRLNPDSHAEGSDPLVRSLVSRTLGPGGAPFTLNKVEIEMEVGVGLATGQGSNPQVWLELSHDGGRTYGSRMLRSMGAMGNRNLRVAWNGPFGDFLPHGGVIKLSCSDPVPFVVTRAWADITVNRP